VGGLARGGVISGVRGVSVGWPVRYAVNTSTAFSEVERA
jgi:hypothetical protein